MDGDLSSEAPQSSTIHVYRDSFAPQPRPRTRAWERAPVEAHAPRLHGQKIWKKVGRKAPEDDKENFESTYAELEKGGVGARKRQRIMGAKENISDAQWQMIKEGEWTIADARQSPKKNGRISNAVNVDALLVPRKRTNTNHLITPRKPPRKIANFDQHEKVTMNSTAEPATASPLKESVAAITDDRHVPNGITTTDGTISEKPERRRKSMRRSSRRLTNTEILEAETISTAPVNNIQPSSLSVVVWSAPAFDIFCKEQKTPMAPATTSKDFGSPSGQEFIAQADQMGAGECAMADSSVLSSRSRSPSPEDFPKVYIEKASTNMHVEEKPAAPQNEPIFEDSFLESIQKDFNANDATSTRFEAVPSTPNRAINLWSTKLESVRAKNLDNSKLSTTPQSKRKTPKRGSRRSTRLSEFDSSDILAGSAEAAGTTEGNSTNGAVSPLPSQDLDLLAPQPGTPRMGGIHSSMSLGTADLSISLGPLEANGDNEDSSGSRNPSAEGDQQEACQFPGSPRTSSSETTTDKLESSPKSVEEPQLPFPDNVQEDTSIETSVEYSTYIQSSPATTGPVSFEDAQPPSGAENQVLDLFPSSQELDSGSHPDALEADNSSVEIAGDFEHDEAVPATEDKSTNITECDDNTADIESTLSPITPSAVLHKDTLEKESRPLVDHDDTDLLRDFVTRVKANKLAKAATGIPKRKRSLPHSPLQLPLGTEANSSPSALNANQDDFDISAPTESPNKRRKHHDHSLDEDELAEPRSTRRSNRTRLPVKTPLAAPSFIPVRRLGQDGDNTVTLRRSEEKELAALTRVNTRKNKANAVHPAEVLAKKAEEKDDPASRQRALKQVFDEKIQKKESKKGKTVVWAEELAQFQTNEGKKVVIKKENEKEQPVEEKKTAVKVGMRSKMSLGMAVNGTPAPKRKLKGRS